MPGSTVSIGEEERGWLGVRKEPGRGKAASAEGMTFVIFILMVMCQRQWW